MKIDVARILGVVAVAGALAVVGCTQKSESEPGVAERTGAALDRAADKTVEVSTNVAGKTVEAAKTTAAATKDVAGQAVEKTGAALEKAGAATEKTGANMQR